MTFDQKWKKGLQSNDEMEVLPEGEGHNDQDKGEEGGLISHITSPLQGQQQGG